MASFNTLSGYESRVLLGSKAVGTTLSVGFDNMVESEFLQIMSHYATAKGSYETFSLPGGIFAGMANSGQVTPSGFVWRYGAVPSVDWVKSGIGNVTVSFVAVPS